ncbi:MAG: hypothetical protein Kow00108_17710 [Calditrichia bacterium]
MKSQIILIALILLFKPGFSQKLNKDDYETVKSFIEWIKKNDMDKLKTKIAYPLKRMVPLPDIDNEIEFVERYNEIFDDSLKHKIISSDINTDWSAVGWRGIMLKDGDIWLDYDGRLLAVNYQSTFEHNKRIELIEKEKASIHESVRDFKEPVLIIETKKFKIRIDKQFNGKYRYASWSINSKMSAKPALIIHDGTVKAEGSGGNHRYEFINGNYTYDCLINVLRADDTPPAELVVYQNNKEILHEPGLLKRK